MLNTQHHPSVIQYPNLGGGNLGPVVRIPQSESPNPQWKAVRIS